MTGRRGACTRLPHPYWRRPQLTMRSRCDYFLHIIDPEQMYGFGKRRAVLPWTRLVSAVLVLYIILFTVATDPDLYLLYATYWVTMLVFL